jgi:hypothetical protein
LFRISQIKILSDSDIFLSQLINAVLLYKYTVKMGEGK